MPSRAGDHLSQRRRSTVSSRGLLSSRRQSKTEFGLGMLENQDDDAAGPADFQGCGVCV